MILTGLATLGRDAEVRYLPDGKAVANLALASNWGKKGTDGNRATQWVDASLWGERAEKLAQYLLKGTKVVVVLEEPHIEAYQKDGKDVPKLVARVSSIEFAGSPAQSGQPAQQPRPSVPPRQAAPAARPSTSGFDDTDDDIPFLINMNTVRDTMGTSPSLSRAKYGKTLHLLRCNQTDC